MFEQCLIGEKQKMNYDITQDRESNLKTNLMVLGADIISIMEAIPLLKNKYTIVDDIMNKF